MIWQISIREGMKAAEQRMKELQKLIENGENHLQYKFPVHSKHHRLACFAKNGSKKAVNLFQDLLLHVLSLGGGLFNFGIGWAAALLAIRQPGKCFLSLCYF